MVARQTGMLGVDGQTVQQIRSVVQAEFRVFSPECFRLTLSYVVLLKRVATHSDSITTSAVFLLLLAIARLQQITWIIWSSLTGN